MAIIRVPVRIDYPIAGGPGVNVLHISTQPGGQPGDLGEALDSIETMYRAMALLWASGTVITIGEGMIEDPLGAPTYLDDDSRTVGGTGTGGSTSALLAVVAGWRTASATRSGRGRTFFGPLAKATVEEDGTVAPTPLGVMRQAVNAFVDDSRSANGWAFGVLSTTQGTFREVTGVSVRDRLAFLSSRRD